MGAYIKWILCVIIILLAIINYFAFIEILDKTLITYIENILISLGYLLPIRKILSFLFNLVIPGIPVIGFVVDIGKRDFSNKLKKIYSRITNAQLILLSILMPFLLYLQNHFYINLMNLQNIDTGKKYGK